MAPRRASALLLCALVACSSRPPPPAPPDARPVAVAADAAPAAPSPEQRKQTVLQLVDQEHQAIARGDLAAAERFVAEASRAAGGDASLTRLLAGASATLFAYRQDFAGAARQLAERLPGAAPPAAFALQNTLVMLHTAEGDLAAALVACDGMTAAGQRASEGNDKAATFVMLKEHWHRAYLLRMVAVAEKGGKRGEALRAAEKAREAYRQLATPLGTHGDSVGVLDGFFAVHAGDRRAALAAAKQVNWQQDDDVEDLYLEQMAFDAGGDAATAQAVREHILALHEISIADAAVRMWLARDGAKPERRSPRHPGAPLP